MPALATDSHRPCRNGWSGKRGCGTAVRRATSSRKGHRTARHGEPRQPSPPRVHTRRFREPGCPQLPAMEEMPETAEPGREGVRGQCAHRHPAGPVRGVGGDGFGSWSGAGRTARWVGLRATPPTFPCLLSGDTPENISFLAVFRPMVFMFPTMFSLLAACHHAGMPRRAQRASSMPK